MSAEIGANRLYLWRNVEDNIARALARISSRLRRPTARPEAKLKLCGAISGVGESHIGERNAFRSCRGEAGRMTVASAGEARRGRHRPSRKCVVVRRWRYIGVREMSDKLVRHVWHVNLWWYSNGSDTVAAV